MPSSAVSLSLVSDVMLERKSPVLTILSFRKLNHQLPYKRHQLIPVYPLLVVPTPSAVLRVMLPPVPVWWVT